MGRIRTIKPETPQSESIGRLSRDARLLFVQLWTVVDDEGRARAASRMLASLLYPYDDDAPMLIDGWLEELEAEGCVVRYKHGGASYIALPNWLKHQKVDHPKPSKIPPPPEVVAIIRDASRDVAPDPRTMDHRTSVWVGVRERVVRTFAEAGSPNVPDTSRVEVWRSRDYNPEICVAVVGELVRRKPSISSLAYFDQAIADAHVVPKGNARAGPHLRAAKPSHLSVLQEDLGHGPASHNFEHGSGASDHAADRSVADHRLVQKSPDRERRALANERRAERAPAFVDDREDG